MSNPSLQNKTPINSPFSACPVKAGGLGGIIITDGGKRFNRDWIFRHLNYTFETGKAYAITGPNGSGKSTLLQALAGSMVLSEGGVEYGISNIEYRISNRGTDEQRNKDQGTGNRGTRIKDQGTEEQRTGNREQENEETNPKQFSPTIIPPENIYQYIGIAAPYIDLVEEMTAKEFLYFHQKFKPLLPAVSIDEIFSVIGLEKSANKQTRYFSSGMKQRLKLAQAIFSDVPVLLLDEPCTNLDAGGYQLYHALINNYCVHKLIMVSSNDEQEISFCTERINIMDYKK